MKNKKVMLLVLSLFLIVEVIFYLGYNSTDLQGKFQVNNGRSNQQNYGQITTEGVTAAPVLPESIAPPDTYLVNKIEDNKNLAEEASVVAEESYKLSLDYYNSNDASSYASSSNDVYDAVADAEQAVTTAKFFYDQVVSNYDKAKQSYEDAGEMLASQKASLNLMYDNLDGFTENYEDADEAYSVVASDFEIASDAFYDAGFVAYEMLDIYVNVTLDEELQEKYDTYGLTIACTSKKYNKAGMRACALDLAANAVTPSYDAMMDAYYLMSDYEVDVAEKEQQISELEEEYNDLKEAYDEAELEYTWGAKYYESAVEFLELARSYQEMLAEL